MIWAVLAAVCAVRIAYLWRAVEYSESDEWTLVKACYGRRLTGKDEPSPLRRGYVLLGRLSLWLQRKLGFSGQSYAALAGLSTVAGCVACATWVGCSWQTVLCVGTSPLMLGLGRRALADVPLVAVQCLTLALAHVCPWAAAVAVVAMLLVKESSFSALPGMALWSALSGDPWWPYAAGLGCWAILSPSHIRWLLKVGGPRRGEGEYGAKFCHGGWLRLIVDLALVSPVVVGAAIWLHNSRLLAVGAIVAFYGAPFLHQQIRTCLLADVLLRVIAAPLWWLTLPMDVWVFWRLWWRGRTYDPHTSQLVAMHGMAPQQEVD